MNSGYERGRVEGVDRSSAESEPKQGDYYESRFYHHYYYCIPIKGGYVASYKNLLGNKAKGKK